MLASASGILRNVITHSVSHSFHQSLYLLNESAAFARTLICSVFLSAGIQGHFSREVYARRGKRNWFPVGGFQQTDGDQTNAALEQTRPEGVSRIRDPTQGKQIHLQDN